MLHGLFLIGGLVCVAAEPRLLEPAAIPDFWRSRYEDALAAVESATKGEARLIATSAGGRPVHVVAYGEPVPFESQANYSSATGARDPDFYARRPADAPPTVLIIGPVHGQEVENAAGTVHLIRVAETGADWRGKEWPELHEKLRLCRTLIVPLPNPDGRVRCPYDAFIGLPIEEMTRIGQGTRKDGSLYGWPGAKRVHPMKGDVGLLGAYFNDDGVNLMHDDFFDPMANETKALLDLAKSEAPDVVINLHSHGSNPVVLPTTFVPRYVKEAISKFGERLKARYEAAGLPTGDAPPVREDEGYPPPSFNLTSALHHVCGAVSMLFECTHGTVEPRYPKPTHDDILDLQLILYDELLAFALENPRPKPRSTSD